MLDLQLLHLRLDLEEPGVEVVETVRQRILGLPRLRLAAGLLRHRAHPPLRLGQGYLPLVLSLVVNLNGRGSPFAGAGLGRRPNSPSTCRTGESWKGVQDSRLIFCRLDDDRRCRRAPRCFGGLPLPVPPLRQAAVQLGPLASGASRAGPVRAFGRDPRLLAGVACTFGADQPYCRRRDLLLDDGGLSRHALLILFPNPLEVR